MAKYRTSLPQLQGGLFLTDGGVETTLIFHENLDLPHFAAFHILKTAEGEAALRRYFRRFAELSGRFDAGLILESPTWRANADWGAKLGYTREALAEANRQAIRLLEELRREHETEQTAVVVSGCLGPRGDGYIPGRTMSVEAAADYHRAQIETFADTSADMVSAMTLNYVEEAVGIALAARQAGMPVALSFTVETDGKLPAGQPLKSAIEQVDEATSGYPCYYMINCAHPTHFGSALDEDGPWLNRIRGLKANASCKSHAELDEAAELDIGDPAELGAQYAALKRQLHALNVMGGCCGTDHRHVDRIAAACSPLFG
ncbi:MAG: homocysteine S-methyltransferase family protein [Methylococcus sp.]|nr:homocysteine S-methyltransferase family protein [Methylococcus sp.]